MFDKIFTTRLVNDLNSKSKHELIAIKANAVKKSNSLEFANNVTNIVDAILAIINTIYTVASGLSSKQFVIGSLLILSTFFIIGIVIGNKKAKEIATITLIDDLLKSK